MNDWISIEDNLPEDEQEVLGYAWIGRKNYRKEIRKRGIVRFIFVNKYFYENNIFLTNCECGGNEREREIFEVTHWMSLPKPPEEK